MVLRSILVRRLFVFWGLIRSRCFVSLRECLAVPGRNRGGDLYWSARLQPILSINDDLFSFLQPVVDQCLSTVDLSDPTGRISAVLFGVIT